MKTIQSDMVYVQEVIICTKKRRGNGVDDPIRIITEIFTKDGDLIAEYDPMIIHPDSELPRPQKHTSDKSSEK